MGVDESTVSRWLRGANITTQKLVRICDELNISIDWVLTGRGPYESRRPTVADDLQVRLRNASEGIPKPILLAVCELVETVQRQPSRVDEPQRP